MKVVLLIALVAVCYAAKSEDLVKSLPEIGATSFKIYSGYLPIPDSNGKQIHYVFTESQNDPKSDPVVLWLNGGPGCSSMDGLFYENGPYVFPEGSAKLRENEYAWNKLASMLYFEAPAGVGYSILGNPSNNSTDDNITAINNKDALLAWFSYFPEYNSSDFYISGESYGGIYVPTLAYRVHLHNQYNPDQKVNLKGFLVGNGVADWNVDVMSARPDFYWSHTIYSYDTRDIWEEYNCTGLTYEDHPKCNEAHNTMDKLMEDVNLYDIYRDCVHQHSFGSKAKYTNWLGGNLKVSIPCVDDYGLTDYMNREDVREAFHISNSITYDWEVCTNLNYTIDYKLGSYYTYPILVNAGYRILIYSGDTDAAVPINGSKKWIKKLVDAQNMNITNPWREWNLDNDYQVAGFTINYEKDFSFTSIRGTGHMSIQWKRPEGYKMFKYFLAGKQL